ncbi:MAG TPA: hypothetical protein VGD99_11300 [Anaerolineae bacterium]
MAADFKLDKDFWANINEAVAEVMTLVAEKTEEAARRNIEANEQVDTRFMEGSTYTITPKKGSTYSKTFPSGSYVNKHRGISKREKAPEAALPKEYDALTGVAAPYAVHQEERKSFLYQGLTDVRDKFDSLGGEVKL